jgi:hypothetical protein
LNQENQQYGLEESKTFMQIAYSVAGETLWCPD